MRTEDIEQMIGRLPELERKAQSAPELDQVLAALRESGETMLVYLRTPWWQAWKLPRRFHAVTSACDRLKAEVDRLGW